MLLGCTQNAVGIAHRDGIFNPLVRNPTDEVTSLLLPKGFPEPVVTDVQQDRSVPFGRGIHFLRIVAVIAN